MAHKRRKRRPWILPLLVLFLVASAFLFLIWTNESLDWSELFETRSESSWAVLEEVRELQVLETAVYTLRAVFPYDFADATQEEWRYLKNQYDRDPGLFLEKTDPAWHGNGRVPEAWEHAAIYDLCRRVGMDPGLPDYRFLVISSTVRGGSDLAAWADELDGAGPGIQELPDGIRIEEDENGRRILVLPPPPVFVTSFSMDDRDSVAEGFPNVPLSPENWRVLAEALTPLLKHLAVKEGLLDMAGEQSREFLHDVFLASGFSDVFFE